MGKAWIIVAVSLITAGILVFLVSFIASSSNFAQMFNTKYETNSYEISEKFNKISVNIDVTDITFVPSGDGTSKVVCYEQQKVKHAVSVEDETLTVSLVDSRKWYEHIGINMGTPSVTVYLPQTEYRSFVLSTHTGDVKLNAFKFESIHIKATTGDVECGASASGLIKIETDTGDIDVCGVSAGELALSVSTGEIEAESINCAGNVGVYVSTGDAELTNLNCKALISDGSTGDITLENVIASESFSIVRSTGDVLFKNSDANEICVETDTGYVKGSLCTPKIFMPKTSTGDINVPETTAGGKCKITTSTGDISITVK